jgi:hypothetical protein
MKSTRIIFGVVASLGVAFTTPAKAGNIILGIGNGVTANDPFLRSFVAPEISAEYRFNRFLGVSALTAWRPSMGDASRNALSHQLVNEFKISPDFSPVVFEGRIGVNFLPAQVQIGEHAKARVGVQFGVGTAHTIDDLEALQCEDDPQCSDTQKQWHLTAFYGLSGEVLWNERYGMRIRMDRVRHIETIDSTTLQMKTIQYVSADFLLAF